MCEFGHYEDPEWEAKYMYMHRPVRKPAGKKSKKQEDASEPLQVSDIVNSPKLDEINRMLRDGLV